jgi:hypothetical protein
LWWKLDFGRPVDLGKIRLMVRADFPHDSYWKKRGGGVLDGSLVSIQITNSAEFQEFSFPKRQVAWFRIHDLVPEDPARWCAFIEVEAWGHDLPDAQQTFRDARAAWVRRNAFCVTGATGKGGRTFINRLLADPASLLPGELPRCQKACGKRAEKISGYKSYD